MGDEDLVQPVIPSGYARTYLHFGDMLTAEVLSVRQERNYWVFHLIPTPICSYVNEIRYKELIAPQDYYIFKCPLSQARLISITKEVTHYITLQNLRQTMISNLAQIFDDSLRTENTVLRGQVQTYKQIIHDTAEMMNELQKVTGDMEGTILAKHQKMIESVLKNLNTRGI